MRVTPEFQLWQGELFAKKEHILDELKAQELMTELFTEALDREPAYELQLAGQNLSLVELRQIAVEALAARDTFTDEWLLSIRIFGEAQLLIQELKASQSAIGQADLDRLQEILAPRVRSANAQKAAAARHQPSRDAKAEAFSWLASQPLGQQPAELARQIFKRADVEYATAVLWEREYRFKNR